jgi:hypothetical protein
VGPFVTTALPPISARNIRTIYPNGGAFLSDARAESLNQEEWDASLRFAALAVR